MYITRFSRSLGGRTVVAAAFICVACYSARAVADTTEVYEYVSSWGGYGSGPGEFDGPGGMGRDQYGNLYVCDLQNYRVQKFDSLGTFLMMFGEQGGGPGQFLWPRDVAVDGHGYIYVCDYDPWDGDPSWVHKFDSLGSFVLRWGGQGSVEPGQLYGPNGIAVGDSGYVFVGDMGYRIQRFTPDGDFSLLWTHPDTAVVGGSHVGTYPGSVYTRWVTGDEYLFRHDIVGNIILSFSSGGPDSGQVGYPVDYATDSEGNLYVADGWNKRASKFDSLGNFITMWGEGGPQPWPTLDIAGIAADLQDAIYVSDWTQNRVVKYRRTIVAVKAETVDPLDRLCGLRLAQNYPNPFVKQTVIGYAVGDVTTEGTTRRGAGTGAVGVHLEVYNLLGQLVRTLVVRDQVPGAYSVVWDGRSDEGQLVASGVYTYQLRVGDQMMSRRCVVIR